MKEIVSLRNNCSSDLHRVGKKGTNEGTLFVWRVPWCELCSVGNRLLRERNSTIAPENKVFGARKHRSSWTLLEERIIMASHPTSSLVTESLIKRPEGFPYPHIWSNFSGLKPTVEGKIPQFWIQDLTDDTFEYVLNVVCNSFLKNAVLSKVTKLHENRKAVEIVQFIWKVILESHLSLVAFTTNQEGNTVFAGCNILALVKGNEKPWENFQESEIPLREIFEVVDYIEGKFDIKEKYGVDEYLGALGLWVEPVFRGQGVGVELLKARVPLCKTIGLTLTATLFTGIAAQKCAAKAGFELLLEEDYSHYRNSKGFAVFTEAEGKSFMYMVMKIE